MLKKRSVVLSGHATSVALEAEFWAVLDALAEDRTMSRAGFLAWVDETRGRRPLASACRVLALEWAAGNHRLTSASPGAISPPVLGQVSGETS